MSSYPKVFTDLRSTRSHVCTRVGGSPATRENLRFSLVAGLPPTLVHTWDLVDLRCGGNLGM